MYWYIVSARLVPHVYTGLAFIGDPAIIRDPALICTLTKTPLLCCDELINSSGVNAIGSV